MGLPVEIKHLVPFSALGELHKRLDLGDPREREVWFFDRRLPALSAAGAILRLRRGPKDEELTVKLRGRALPADLAALFAGEGYKAEIDCAGDEHGALQVTPASSLTVEDLPLGEGPPAGGATLRTRLSKAQRALFTLAAWARPLAARGAATLPPAPSPDDVDWDALVAWGPIHAESWKWKPGDLGIEVWTVAGEGIVEVSRRADGDPAEADAALRAQLAAWGVPTAGLPGGKTAWAMRRLGAL